MRILQEGITNDEEMNYGKDPDQSISCDRLFGMISTLPESSRDAFFPKNGQIILTIQRNILIDTRSRKVFRQHFIGIQPQRGYGFRLRQFTMILLCLPLPNIWVFISGLKRISRHMP
ncbi:MAG: hypothetical protein Ct9H300mP28_30120 [Pseudomonadota bacterium]|nr:MAG: hypothetical protein Ct9H300mP28_30120 [Pseudomonadota bacterium]